MIEKNSNQSTLSLKSKISKKKFSLTRKHYDESLFLSTKLFNFQNILWKTCLNKFPRLKTSIIKILTNY